MWQTPPDGQFYNGLQRDAMEMLPAVAAARPRKKNGYALSSRGCEGVPRVGREPPGGRRAEAGAIMERGDRCRAAEFRGARAGATREERALPEDRSDRRGLGAPGSACTVRVRFRCKNGRSKRELGLGFGMKSLDYNWLRWSDPHQPRARSATAAKIPMVTRSSLASPRA